MTFKFFDHMENILGDRKTVQNQSTTSSTFSKKKLKSTMSTFTAQSDTPISSPSTSSTVSTNSAKKQVYEHSPKSECLNINKQALEKSAPSNSEKTVCSTSVSNTQKTKRPQHGSESRTAASKVELEKQWLQHLKNVEDKNKIKEEKQQAYEKRKAEEVQMKMKLIALKERQLDMKQKIAKRKYEEAAEWHRDKLYIEKQKCRLLKKLLETHTSSSNKKFKTDTDSSLED